MVVSSEHGTLSKVTEAGEEEKGKVEGDEVRGMGEIMQGLVGLWASFSESGALQVLRRAETCILKRTILAAVPRLGCDKRQGWTQRIL